MKADVQEIYNEACNALATCEDPGILRSRVTRGERDPSLRVDAHAARGGSPGEHPLSDAELSVLRLLRSELSQREIASELHLSFNTIKTHTRNIYRKLGVVTRADAIDRARSLKLS